MVHLFVGIASIDAMIAIKNQNMNTCKWKYKTKSTQYNCTIASLLFYMLFGLEQFSF